MPAISTEECHVFEYEIGEIKVGYVAAFGTGKRYATQANVGICGSDPVNQHVC